MKRNKTLRRAIYESDTTQREVAVKASMHETTLSAIICGRLNPSDAEKERIAMALDMPAEELFKEG